MIGKFELYIGLMSGTSLDGIEYGYSPWVGSPNGESGGDGNVFSWEGGGGNSIAFEDSNQRTNELNAEISAMDAAQNKRQKLRLRVPQR